MKLLKDLTDSHQTTSEVGNSNKRLIFEINRKRFLKLNLFAFGALLLNSCTKFLDEFGSVGSGWFGNSKLTWFKTMGKQNVDVLDLENWMGLYRSTAASKPIKIADVTDKSHAGVQPVTGHFSGEQRYYDFAGLVTDVDFLAAQRNAMQNNVDVVFNTASASINNPANVEYLLYNNGAYYKDLLYQTVKVFNSGEFQDCADMTYWELGNEINNSNNFSIQDNGLPIAGNLLNADDYVDFLLTPALDAIYTASEEIYGDPLKVRVLPACVSGVRGQNRAFFDHILNSTITQSDRIQNQTWMLNKKVWEVIDRASIHYVFQKVSDGGEADKNTYESLYSAWIASGKLINFIHTEELGRSGKGAYDVAKIFFRFMNFWLEKDNVGEPDRICFWGNHGTHPGTKTKGVESQRLIGPFLRDWPLSLAGSEEVIIHTTDRVEWYAFRATTPEGHWRYIIHLMPVIDYTSTVEAIRIKFQPAKIRTEKWGPRKLEWWNITQIDRVEFPDETIQPEEIHVDSDGVQIVLNKELNLNDSYLIRVHLVPQD